MKPILSTPISRRTFLPRATAAVAGTALFPLLRTAEAPVPRIRVGACVVNLDQALEAGLDGVEVGVGGAADRLEIADPAVRHRYKEQIRKTGLPISSLMMGLLNEFPLATDPRGPAWLAQSIDAARDLGVRVILVAFFWKGDLLDENGNLKQADVDSAVKRLKDAAPHAKEAGVILAIENYLNAEQNARILDRVNHESVQCYYDCFNTGGTKGYDVPKELRFLKDRVVQLHFKNGPDFLETGKVKYEPVAAAIKEIGFKGWIVLETSAPTKNAVADVKRNAAYARSLFA